MVLRQIRNCGLTALVVGAALLGGCRNCEYEYKEDNVPAVSQVDREYSEKDKAVERLAEALGDRLENKSALYDLSLEDLTNHADIYENAQNFRNKEQYKGWFEHYNFADLDDEAKKRFEKYSNEVGLGWDFRSSDADITALVYHGIKEGDVELEAGF